MTHDRRDPSDDVTVQPEPLPPTGGSSRAHGSPRERPGRSFFAAGSRGPGRERDGAAERGRARLADAVEGIGERIEDQGHVLRARGGARRKAGKAAIQAGRALESGASYLREHEIDELRQDIEERVRERPLASLALAAAAGFLLARIIRD